MNVGKYTVRPMDASWELDCCTLKCHFEWLFQLSLGDFWCLRMWCYEGDRVVSANTRVPQKGEGSDRNTGGWWWNELVECEVGGFFDDWWLPGNSVWPLFGWLNDPFKWLSDLQLGDEKVTLNHLVHNYSWHLIEDFTYACGKMSLRSVYGNCGACSTQMVYLEW